MKTEDICFKCKKDFDWKDLIWSLHEVKDYRSKTYKCECGHEMHMFKPISKELKEEWKNLLGGC